MLGLALTNARIVIKFLLLADPEEARKQANRYDRLYAKSAQALEAMKSGRDATGLVRECARLALVQVSDHLREPGRIPADSQRVLEETFGCACFCHAGIDTRTLCEHCSAGV